MMKKRAYFVLKDNDECASGTHSCHGNANCTNTAGSYMCECQSSYVGDGGSCIPTGKMEFQ